MQEAPATVYGALLNQRSALAALGEAVYQAPYKAPPQAPVLYIKPRNTWVGEGAAVVVPAGVDELEMGATLGLVIGLSGRVAGYRIVNDISVPHASLYRPALRFKARDGFCPMSAVLHAPGLNPDAADIEVHIDGALAWRCDTRELVRPAAQLLAEVSAFMTLAPGDVLLLGVAAGAPRARAGQGVRICVPGLGELRHTLVAEGAAQ